MDNGESVGWDLFYEVYSDFTAFMLYAYKEYLFHVQGDLNSAMISAFELFLIWYQSQQNNFAKEYRITDYEFETVTHHLNVDNVYSSIAVIYSNIFSSHNMLSWDIEDTRRAYFLVRKYEEWAVNVQGYEHYWK